MSKSIRSVLEDLAKEQYDDGWCASNVDKPHDGPDYNAIDQALKDIAQIIDEAKPEYIQALPSDNISAIQRGAVDQYQSNLREALGL